jgi:hypothetical protein
LRSTFPAVQVSHSQAGGKLNSPAVEAAHSTAVVGAPHSREVENNIPSIKHWNICSTVTPKNSLWQR